MKRTFCAALFSVLLILLFAPAAAAMDTSVDPSVRVYDYADLLTDEEEAALSQTANQISTDQGVDLVVVTIDDAEGLSSMEYADDFFDYNDFSADGVLMLINMDEREVWFSTSGTCIRVFSDRRIESMVQSCLGDLSNGDYSGAVETFFSKAQDYLIQGEEPDSGIHYVDNPEDLDYTPETALERTTRRVPLYLLAAAVISGISVAVMAGVNRSAKRAREAAHYLENGSIRITLRNDRFLRSTMTKTRIDNDSGSGGGGGGSSVHTSSSGASHGGGGGHF